MLGRKTLRALTILALLGVLVGVAPLAAHAIEAANDAEKSSKGVEAIDWAVIVGYFIILFFLARWVIKKNKDTPDDYFLAGRGLGWFVVGASIFASNIGSEHLVGLAGSGTTDGVAMAHYELHAWCLLVLGWVLVPFYARSKVFTMPQFLEKRFSPAARWVLSIISLVAYIVTKIAVGIFAGGIVFSVLLPEININLGFMILDSFWLGSILVLIFTGVYTILGGLRAVAYTEALQTVVLIVGSGLVTFYGLAELGGWQELRDTVGSDMFNLWKPLVPEEIDGVKAEGSWAPVDKVVESENGEKVHRIAWYFNSDFPWLGMLFCAPIIGLWYWCTDQYIVQRALGASNETEARRGTICASFLKLLPVFIFIIPGMICFALMIQAERGENNNANFDDIYKEGQVAAAGDIPADETLEQTRDRLKKKIKNHGDSGKAFPLMVREVLPAGVRGIVVAGLLAALMSSLAGVFNACSTLFTMDLYIKFRPTASEHQLVKMGRIATGLMVVVGVIWIPVIRGSEGLYLYLQSVQGYLAPPIFVVFFLGIFWKRLNGKGCLAALILGFMLGIFRLAVDTPIKMKWFGIDEAGKALGYTDGSFLWIINKMYFQYYSLLIFIICSIAMIVVSYMSKAPSEEQIQGLTFGTLSAEDKEKTRNSWSAIDVIASVLVCVAILAAYLYFNG